MLLTLSRRPSRAGVRGRGELVADGGQEVCDELVRGACGVEAYTAGRRRGFQGELGFGVTDAVLCRGAIPVHGVAAVGAVTTAVEVTCDCDVRGHLEPDEDVVGPVGVGECPSAFTLERCVVLVVADEVLAGAQRQFGAPVNDRVGLVVALLLSAVTSVRS